MSKDASHTGNQKGTALAHQKAESADGFDISVTLLCGQATWVHLSERSLDLIGFHVLALRRPLFQSSAGAPQPP